MFVGHIVLVARELWRVLRDDGTFWLNFGDSYSGSWGNYAPGGIKNEQRPRTENGARYERPAYSSTTFKPPTANTGRKSNQPTRFRLRADLTPEQRAYVLSELAKVDLTRDATQEGLE